MIANKILHATVLLLIYCGDQFVASEIHHRRLQSLSIINMILSDEDKVLIKSLYLKGNTAKRLTDEFSEKAGQSVVFFVLISRRTVFSGPSNPLRDFLFAPRIRLLLTSMGAFINYIYLLTYLLTY